MYWSLTCLTRQLDRPRGQLQLVLHALKRGCGIADCRCVPESRKARNQSLRGTQGICGLSKVSERKIQGMHGPTRASLQVCQAFIELHGNAPSRLRVTTVVDFLEVQRRFDKEKSPILKLRTILALKRSGLTSCKIKSYKISYCLNHGSKLFCLSGQL